MVTQNIKILTNKKLFLFFAKKKILLKKNFFFTNHFLEKYHTAYIINLKITPNNTIINLVQNNKIVYSISAGKLKLKSSKKNYKTIYNLIIVEFLKKINELQIKKNFIIRMQVPKLLRHKVLRRMNFDNQELNIYQIPRKSVYNGCRVKKIKRKKRKGLRLFKPKF